MPLPKPNKTESQDEFVSRCMSDDVMVSEYPDEEQRLAICTAQYTGKIKIELCSRVNDNPEFEAKTEGNTGYIYGYACVYDIPDLGGDIVRRGSFARAISNQIAAGSVPLMITHFKDGGDSMESVGVITKAEETETGLWVECKLDGTPESQRIRQKVMANPAPFGMSIGWRVRPYGWETIDGGGKEYTEIDLKEVTITLMPMQEDTLGTLSGKSARDILDDFEKRLKALETQQETSGKTEAGAVQELAPVKSEKPLDFTRHRREREMFFNDKEFNNGY